jgi:hypothetical protein
MIKQLLNCRLVVLITARLEKKIIAAWGRSTHHSKAAWVRNACEEQIKREKAK